MRVLVTGATGFIGCHCLEPLCAKGYEVHAVSSSLVRSTSSVQWHQANLLDAAQTRKVLRTIKPTHLLHLAWYTEHGKYWTASENLTWVAASLALVEEFIACGGERLVTAGTCAEYEWGHGICIEDVTPVQPATLYGTYKHALQLMLSSWCKQCTVSSAWGRVFSLYGPHEHPRRLVASVIKNLLLGQRASCGNASLVRDYLHAQDVALAFVTLLGSELQGAVNIGSGEGISLQTLVELIAEKTQRLDLIDLAEIPTTDTNQVPLLTADIARLSSTGWSKSHDLDSGLDNTIAWWREHLATSQAG